MLSLDIGAAIGHAEDALRVGFVIRKQQRWLVVTVKKPLPEFEMRRLDRAIDPLQTRPVAVASAPGPLVAEPQSWHDVQLRLYGPAIVD